MPEIDLPTVIFALVALFVAWKLRSVLGMRQDSERPGELMAPLRRAPGPASAPVAQPDAAPLGAGFAGSRGSLEGRRRARSRGLERPRRHRRRRIAASRRKPFCPAPGSPTTWSSMLSPPAIPTPSKA